MRDVPYQSLMKMFLSEKVEEELHGAAKYKVVFSPAS